MVEDLAKLCIKILGKGNIQLNDSSTKPFLRFDLDTTKARNAFMYKPTISLEEELTLIYQQKEL